MTTPTQLATALRFIASDMVDAANSGHPGLPLGMADVATVLWTNHLRFDAADPDWPDRDRFVLSAGHGSALLYALAWLNGIDGVELEHLRRFRELGSPAAGHPEWGHFPGVETTTGPLGQGLATAVGMAIAEERLRSEFGAEHCDHRTWVLAGDGCLMEGISQETISLAAHLGLERLIVLWDDNQITIDGATDLSTSDDQLARFAAAGWRTIRVDGHDHAEIDRALTAAAVTESGTQPGRPTLVACRTVIGCGAPTREGTSAIHGSPLGPDERAAMADRLGWEYEPFDVPSQLLTAWRNNGARCAAQREAWMQRVGDDPAGTAMVERLASPLGDATTTALADLRETCLASPMTEASRVTSNRVLDAVVPTAAGLLGGSADLSGSNGTKTPHHVAFTSSDRSGNYLHYGIREHAMAAAMNGIALHGGFVAFGGTFLVFSDYSRPAIRLAALMGVGVVHVLTHDSIGVGEDGPTHQPVEHLCSLRAIPNLTVIRPADGVETIEAWQVAFNSPDRPVALILSRQALRPITRRSEPDGGVSVGGYIVADDPNPDIVLLASGSELSIALDTRALLADDGVSCRVVSMPSMERFAAQSAAYRAGVLGTAPRLAIEASIGQSWHRWLREQDTFLGMDGFGASGPAADLYQHFGITATAAASLATGLISSASNTLIDH